MESAFIEAVDLCKEYLFTISAGVFSLHECIVATDRLVLIWKLLDHIAIHLGLCRFKLRWDEAVKVKVKVMCSTVAVNGTPFHSYEVPVSLAIWNHSVTCHPTQVNTPILTGWYSIYLPRRDGWLTWPRRLVTCRDGLPARRLSHPS